jgi:hypothetical protein
LTHEQTAAFYDRQEVKVYVYNVDYLGSYAQCTEEQAKSMEAIKITLKAE